MRKSIVVAAVTAVLVSPALAQSGAIPIGAISATIEGAPYEARTLEMPAEGSATADFRTFGPLTALSIQGHDPSATSPLANVLGLEINLTGTDASASIVEASVSYFPDGLREFYVSDEDPAHALVVLDALSLDGDAGAARGSFSALLCKRESTFSPLDPDDCLAVEGTFETELRRAQ